ncbi:guanine nucleotide exchange protein for ADP-robosylation factor [Purpureocillium takamizusanense]|uniref:Guanine nucleotide exchange protein for ADP-robosylation factor n=1 Tax=Purpureocillium takamizusanense TaxID=2060973 RepID=A0A9Q8QKD7_9HYPO|nr:guanine nucleotide exchange protein for ADP-robosylation factor [Purpureocillium takamizusanense]UNI20431.1 guanine nucleotide exchange protein for ADP-robosylation factor [Purpureocillium takamizusanense]
MSSLKFVVSSLDAIATSKDAQRNKQLADSAKKALDAIKEQDQLPDPDIVFAPLQLATKSNNPQLTNAALDCIGKLISYSYFSIPTRENDAKDGAEPAPPLIERAIDTICDCFQGETTAVEIQLQIVKSLLAAVLNDKIVVHGAGLLKAVRQVYNVFLLSRSTANQQVAQGTLTQMVGTVFERVKTRLHMKEARLNLGSLKHSSSNITFDPAEAANGAVDDDGSIAPSGESGDANGNGAKLTLKDLEHRKSFDDSNLGDGPTMVTRLTPAKKDETDTSVSGQSVTDYPTHDDGDALDAEDEVYIRDAYLVFRSFCNLSTKVLAPDQLYDLRGQPMRSKLISLHLIHTVLNNNITVFTSPLCTIKSSKSNEPTSFLQAVKFYLCLSITRNGASAVDRIFDVCCEIFWLMLKYMRPSFKKEIEVILNEIYLALLSRRNAPLSQKLYFVTILNRLCADPRALVEIYLNYDCDQTVDNIFQTIVEDLSKFSTTPVAITSINEQVYEELRAKSAPASEWQLKGILPPPLTVVHIVPQQEAEPDFPKEYAIKRLSLEALVESLRSLVNWSASLRADGTETVKADGDTKASLDELRPSIDPTASESASRLETPLPPSTPVVDDDPDQLEKEKARKTALMNAIRQFNFKPKRGIKLLLRDGFIASEEPAEIASFLLKEDKLDKAQIGEFLGEGDPQNIDIMHAFVDSMDFTKKRFVDALRQFLQSFRLPGEAQKIDRFMLKFAERYVLGNPNAFANADTAYVLAYSVIMLNTDQHSSKIAKRMSKEEFIKNNRGINDNADLPDEYLIGIYEEIANNEIVLTSEREAAAASGTPASQPTGLAAGLGQALSNVGRDLQREAYVQQSEEISLRSEQLFKNLFKSQRRNTSKAGLKFIPATSSKHVGSMFDVTWMSYFSALSSQMQKAHNLEVNKLCLEGMKLATRIACVFELSTPREAFISALRNTTHLNNPQDMLAKNIEALKVLLELGQTEGNLLAESWKDILMCISQLDRLQLITGGVDESAVPDVSQARFTRTDTSDSRSSTQSRQRPRQRSGTGSRGFSNEIALESRSDEFIRSVDRIFTNTANLSGEAMVHFAKALTEVSWDEIKVSGSNDSPRTYSLQKIVEISYYNMDRVRFEWSNIWDVLGEHFNQVGCHNNMNIVFFALDSLRQLSMRFMEIEELAGFKFQKDFLKPFEHVLANSHNITVKDMVLRCLIQMIQARGDNIRSGWRTMFGVFTVAAREPHESIVNLAYENVNQVYRTKFGVVITQGAFTDLIVCLTEFSKNLKFQKKSLAALELLKSIVPTMLKTPECPLSQIPKKGESTTKAADGVAKPVPTRTSVEEGYWFPVLFAFHDVLMTGEDLEVRSNALEYFFAALVKYGGDFTPEFWDILWRQQLYPIFMVLRSRPELTNVLNHEELSVWLSTTMIQALRNMITLFTHYFDALEHMLDRFLELLALCICQENDTISRIGSNCLQQLILKNVTKFTAEHWARIVGAFCELFERTTAYQLFTAANPNSTASLSLQSNGFDFSSSLSPPTDAPAVDEKSLKINGADENSILSDAESMHGQPSPHLKGEELQTPTASQPLEEFKPSSNLQQQPVVVTAARRRFFNRIISRCVLQLLMIETVNELFSNDAVYTHIPSTELLRLMALLKRSFQFARRFNEDKELRMRLWREGFMKQPPNLLKQESGSAATYVSILFRMFADNAPERLESRPDIEAALVPLCKDIITGYSLLAEESQHRNIMAWRPVVVDVLEGYATFPEDAFKAHIPDFYPMSVELLNKDLSQDLRGALLAVLRRVGEVALGIEGLTKAGDRRRESGVTEDHEEPSSEHEAAARKML